MKRIAIYKSFDEFIIHPFANTTVGLSLATGPYFVMKLHDTKQAIYEAIMKAFDEVQYELPVLHRTEYKSYNSQYLKAIGYKSFKHLERTSKYCMAEIRNNKIEFIPTKSTNGKQHSGWLSENTVYISKDASAENIVDAMNRAFEACQ